MADTEDMMVDDGVDEISPMTLGQFYKRFFPYTLYYSWLNYKNKNSGKEFTHREFSFTINDGVYLRYQSFRDMNEFQQELVRLSPSKIDIGAIFTAQPKHAKSLQPGVFKPVAKELVFDIDMTDYDEIRTCCQGGAICQKCWKFMTIAMHILDTALREDFGFENILWVYSGRRGVHCWVCDERARSLDDAGRRAIAGYLTLIKGGAEQGKKVMLSQRSFSHPHITRSLDLIRDYFEQVILEEQEILLTPERWSKVLAALPDEDLRSSLNAQWLKTPQKPSTKKWEELINAVGKKAAKKGSRFGLGTFESEIMIQYAYPRLDENVTTHLNHLLKSPFCIHPKTGRVCTPIGVSQFDTFDPFAVPTLAQLLREINNGMTSDDTLEKKSHPQGDIMSSSLGNYMKTFEEFVEELRPQDADVKPSLDF